MKSAYWLRIKERRMAANLTQEELARRAGVHKLSVIKWETGQTEPNLQALVQVVAALSLDGLNDLVTIDRNAVLEAIEAARGGGSRPVPPPATVAPPADLEIQEPVPAPKIGNDAVASEKYINPVGEIIEKQEASK